MNSRFNLDSYIADRIRRRITEHEENAILAFIGATGSGKSYSALRMCELVDGSFSTDRIVFDSKDFKRLVNSKLPPGSAILWDDAGVTLDARDWQMNANREIAKIAQSFRFRRYLVIFTMPGLDYIDAKVRPLVHMFFRTRHKYESRGYVGCQPFRIESNPFGPRPFLKYPKPENLGRLRLIYFAKPSPGLTRTYRLLKEEKLNALYETGPVREGPRWGSQAIRTIRDETGWSQRKIAERLGIDVALVNRQLAKASED